MSNLLFWLSFFGVPLLLVLIAAYVFRPSARDAYRAAKRIPFTNAEHSGRF